MATVLIIDSDVAVAQTLKDALSTSGVQSIVTADGTEGLGLAKADPPDVIVLCVELSRISGYSICNKVKKDPKLASVPLILTSSQATEETFEQHKKLRTRADAYLKKPYDTRTVLDIIGQYLPLRSAEPATVAPVEDAPSSDDSVAMEIANEPTDGGLDPAGHADHGEDLGLLGDDAPEPVAEPPGRSLTADLDDLLGDGAPSVPFGTAPPPPERSPEPQLATPEVEEVLPAPAGAAGAGHGDEDVESMVLGDDGDILGAGDEHEPEPPQLARIPEPTPVPLRSIFPTQPQAASGPPEPVTGGDASAGKLRTEVQSLRQKVKQLEQTLHDKELEFNDRLLQESTRSREGLDLKKRFGQLEREIAKHREAAEQARSEADSVRERLVAMQQDVASAEHERQTLSDKLAQLVDKVKSLASERDALRAEADAAREAQENAEQELARVVAMRQKAKKAVDIAMQLIEETGLVQ